MPRYFLLPFFVVSVISSIVHAQRVEYPTDYPDYLDHTYSVDLDSDGVTVGIWRYYVRASAQERRRPILNRKKESIAGVTLGPLGVADPPIPEEVDAYIPNYAFDAEAQAFARVDFGARSGRHGVKGWASIRDDGRYARAKSRSKLSTKTGTRTGRGRIRWRPGWQFNTVTGERKVGRAWVARDPVAVTVTDRLTGNSISEELFDLQVQMGVGSQGSWEDGRLQLNGIDGAFYVAVKGDHLTSPKGSILLEFDPQGIVTQSVSTGVFAGTIPGVGMPAELDLNIEDYLQGSDGYIDLEYDFGMNGDLDTEIDTGGDGLTQIMKYGDLSDGGTIPDPLTTLHDFTYFQAPSVRKLLLGTPFHSVHGESIDLVQPATDDDPYDGFLELASPQNELVAGAFDRTSFRPERAVQAEFDFRMQTEPGANTDGVSFLLVPSWMHNAEGPVEETLDGTFLNSSNPASPEALSIGFQDLGEGGIVTVTWNNRQIAKAELFDPETAELLTSGDWTHASIGVSAVPGGASVNLFLSPDADSDPVEILSNAFAADMDLHQALRPVFASRADEKVASRGIDNVAITFDLSGDANGNGMLDASDIDQLTTAIASSEYLTELDVTLDGKIDHDDLDWWVGELAGTWYGDSNLDGVFDSGDLVKVFVPAKYETGQAAVWSEGDWNADGFFDSSDLVVAFQYGGYEAGPLFGAAAVPEPSGVMPLLGLMFAVVYYRRSGH
ncbi:MAG: hypothetical protein KDB27_25325 [Planctomycetales bacterium]|nr:hypothetical protein [Planctomycetales bacterium]